MRGLFHSKFISRRSLFHAEVCFTQRFISRRAPPAAATQRGKGRRRREKRQILHDDAQTLSALLYAYKTEFDAFVRGFEEQQ